MMGFFFLSSSINKNPKGRTLSGSSCEGASGFACGIVTMPNRRLKEWFSPQPGVPGGRQGWGLLACAWPGSARWASARCFSSAAFWAGVWGFSWHPPFPNSVAKLCVVAAQAAPGTGMSYPSALASVLGSVSLRNAAGRPDEHNAEQVCKVWELSRLRLSALLIFMQLIEYYNSRHFFLQVTWVLMFPAELG